jgi:FixJ family two-component response regulator
VAQIPTHTLKYGFPKGCVRPTLTLSNPFFRPHGARKEKSLEKTYVLSIVDNDESVRVATSKFLQLHGFTVHAFASAEEFLRSPYLGATRCLISDIRMPGMNGLALQERLKANGHRTPIIFVTAFPDARSRERALTEGAICILSKPFDGQTLIDHVHEALSRGG